MGPGQGLGAQGQRGVVVGHCVGNTMSAAHMGLGGGGGGLLGIPVNFKRPK